MKRTLSLAAALVAWMALAPASRAQEEAAPPAAEPEATPAAPKPKPRPKPRPKPKPKPEAKPVEKPPEKPAAEAAEAGTAGAPAAVPPTAKPIPPAVPPAPPLAATPFAAPPVACEPGQAVHYQGPRQGTKGAELWVTRSGTITIDNPLRPLTPDVTRVLQVVVGGKVATAYGPDLLSLSRGASPATLEGTIGGRIHWDAALVALPDTLPINAETGAPPAELRFLECGAAPSAKTLPPPKARRMAPTPEAVAAEADKAAKAASKAAEKAVRSKAPMPAAGQPPQAPGLHLPQGAIP